MNKKIVIAGNHQEFMYYLSAIPAELRHLYIEASNHDKVAGVIADEVIKTGTYYLRPDRYDMFELAESRMMFNDTGKKVNSPNTK